MQWTKPKEVWEDFLSGWAVPEGKDIDSATGFPKKIHRTKDDVMMVLIPAGTFLMGSPETEEERKTFDAGHASMNQGWSGTMDKLEAYLTEAKA